jgi:hypothetical protein
METTLSQLAPSSRHVLRRQVSLLASPGTIASLVIGLAGVQLIAAAGWRTPPRFERLPVFDVFPFLVIIGALWPAFVWHGEGPSKRHYHWSLPVPQARHDLLRVAAGGLWLLAGLVAVEAFQIAAAFANGYGERLADVSLGSWLNYVSAPMTMYLIGSALAVATDHPIRWLLGGMFGVMATATVCNTAFMCSGSWLLEASRHFFGLTQALTAFIGPEIFTRTGIAPGLGAWVTIALGLGAGCGAVYAAARWRAR